MLPFRFSWLELRPLKSFIVCVPLLVHNATQGLWKSFHEKFSQRKPPKPKLTALSTFPKYKRKFDNFEKVHMICSPILLPKSRKLLFQSSTTESTKILI